MGIPIITEAKFLEELIWQNKKNFV
jgi:hypothetical protein